MRRFAIVGLLIANGFGGVWLAWAITAFAGSVAPVWPAYAVALGAFAVAVWRMDRNPIVDLRQRASRLTPLVYLGVVAGEIVALNLIGHELQSHGLVAYLRPTIGLIVGVHFFPLARLFRIPALNLLGIVMVVAALTALGAPSLGLPIAYAIGGDALINGLSLLAITALRRRRLIA